jgi:hypothetical protein
MKDTKKFLCKCSVWTMTMFTKTSRNLGSISSNGSNRDESDQCRL